VQHAGNQCEILTKKRTIEKGQMINIAVKLSLKVDSELTSGLVFIGLG